MRCGRWNDGCSATGMRRQQCGFTLIESLVATGLLVTIALGSAQILTMAIARTRAARDQLSMSLLASTKVDDLAARAADGSIEFSPADTLDRDVDGWRDTATEGGRTFIRRWQVSRVEGFTDGTVVGIVVRVRPESGPGDTRIVTIRERRLP
jgi:Tfp pilus assembly protein PilV